MKLISATPSPYARKPRILLQEKGIPFELQTEVPWNSTTKTPEHNPLEKLPVLILDDGKSVYESHYIMEWLEIKYPAPKYYSCYPRNVDDLLKAKEIEVVCDGICDASVLLVFEAKREHPSVEWQERQMRKVVGGLKALNAWVPDAGYVLEDRLTLADISIGSVLGFLTCRFILEWRSQFPKLASYSDRLEELQSFKDTKPRPQDITDKIV